MRSIFRPFVKRVLDDVFPVQKTTRQIHLETHVCSKSRIIKVEIKKLNFGKARVQLVLVTQGDFSRIKLDAAFERWSLDSDGGIVPHEAAFIVWVVDVIAFVAKLCNIEQNKESLCESAKNKNWHLFSADSTTPSHLPYVGLSLRMSTATSKTLPETRRTSFACGCSI